MAISIERAKSNTRHFAIASIVLLVIAVAVPSRLLSSLVAIALAITTWQLVFHGSTWASLSLQGTSRAALQVTLGILVPLIMSIYFLGKSSDVTALGVLRSTLSPWLLLPAAIIGYMSWASADQLDWEHPFRGFLIAATVLFVICFLGYHGITFGDDDDGDAPSEEDIALVAQSGRYFGQYLIYVAISYAAMLAGLKKRGFFKKRVHI